MKNGSSPDYQNSVLMGSRSGSCVFADGLAAFEKITEQQSAERKAVEERAEAVQERAESGGKASGSSASVNEKSWKSDKKCRKATRRRK